MYVLFISLASVLHASSSYASEVECKKQSNINSVAMVRKLADVPWHDHVEKTRVQKILALVSDDNHRMPVDVARMILGYLELPLDRQWIQRDWGCHNDGLIDLRFSHDGGKFIAGNCGNEVRIWNFVTRACVKTIGLSLGLRDGAFSFMPHNSSQFFRIKDVLALTDIASGKVLQRFIGTSKKPNCLAISPSGTVVITGGVDGIVDVWHRNAKIAHKFQAFTKSRSFVACKGATISGAFYSTYNQSLLLMTHTGLIEEWNLKTGKLRGTATSTGYFLCVSPDGRSVAFAQYDARGPWGAKDLSFTLKEGIRSIVCFNTIKSCAAFFNNNKHLVVSALSCNNSCSSVDIVNVETMETYSFGGHQRIVIGNIAISPSNKKIAASDWKGNVRTWKFFGQHDMQ